MRHVAHAVFIQLYINRLHPQSPSTTVESFSCYCLPKRRSSLASRALSWEVSGRRSIPAQAKLWKLFSHLATLEVFICRGSHDHVTLVVPSHWLRVGRKWATENDKLSGSDDSQCSHVRYWLWGPIYSITNHCPSDCDATGAILSWVFAVPLFPWTTSMSWRVEVCYVGNSWPSCLDCPGLHAGESTSVWRSMVSGNRRMPTALHSLLFNPV